MSLWRSYSEETGCLFTSHMATLIFDIETVGEDFSVMDETTKKSLTRWIKREAYSEVEYEAQLQDLEEGLGFSPLTGQIVDPMMAATLVFPPLTTNTISYILIRKIPTKKPA